MINSKIFCIAILATAMSSGCVNSKSVGTNKSFIQPLHPRRL